MSGRILRRPGARPGHALADVRAIRRLGTALRSSLRGVIASPLLFALSVATMGAGMLMLCAYLLVVLNVRGVLASHAADLSLVAFLPSGTAPAPPGLAELETRLKGLPAVASVRFVSPELALERLRGDLGADAEVLTGLSENPLPASFEIEITGAERTPEGMQKLQAQIAGFKGIAEVRYGEAWIESYARMLQALSWVGLGLGACLLLVLGVIVAGTVRLAVYARSDEIQIQRLVGADGFFVRLPLYLEAALQGGLGAGLALLALYGLHRLGLPLVVETLQSLLGIPTLSFFAPAELAALLAIGIGLSVAAAAVSLLRLEDPA